MRRTLRYFKEWGYGRRDPCIACTIRVMFPAFSVVICNARILYENNMHNSALSWKICYLFFVRITFDLFKIVFLPLYLTFSWTFLKVDIILCIQKGVLIYRWRKCHHFLLWRRNAVRSIFDSPQKLYFSFLRFSAKPNSTICKVIYVTHLQRKTKCLSTVVLCFAQTELSFISCSKEYIVPYFKRLQHCA